MQNEPSNLDVFIKEMHTWSVQGKKPALASGELRYLLDCRRKRLETRGLVMEETLEHRPEDITGQVDRGGDPISAEIQYQEGLRHVVFRKAGKIIRKIKEPVVFYATLLNRKDYREKEITCPNCGHTAMASEMRDGCPYCGTVFEMEDVWPVFSSYYYVPGIVDRSTMMPNIKRVLRRVFTGTFLILSAVLYFYTNAEYPFWARLPLSLLGGALGGGVMAFTGYYLMGLVLLGKAFRAAGRALTMVGGIRTDKKMEEKMRPYEPDFSYPYFEGRLISLLRAIAFSDRRDQLSLYEGDEDLSFLDTIVDMQYRGASKLQDFAVEDGVFHVRIKAYMDVLRYENRMRRRDESYEVCLEKDVEADDPGFSVQKVQCRSCGSSFDAMHRKTCPYCGKPYRLIHDDWMITSIRRR